jgi:hypothetical protein
MFDVKLNGRSITVGLCPKERCEHICLLGQNYLKAGRLRVNIDYHAESIAITSASVCSSL